MARDSLRFISPELSKSGIGKRLPQGTEHRVTVAKLRTKTTFDEKQKIAVRPQLRDAGSGACA